jgi:hypothetical protein
LIPQRLEPGHALFQHRIVLIDQAGFDSVIETAEPLVGLGDSPVEFGEVFSATLGALLSAVDDAGEDSLQSLGLEQTILDMVGGSRTIDGTGLTSGRRKSPKPRRP